VPEKLHGRKLRKQTITGTPEEVAKTLGLKLGPKRRPRSRPSKPGPGELLVVVDE